MKIKEVIERTGLTDRAIRLYIENGLIKPDCETSYNGRKKLEFSADDIKQLNNIATLRKADFSIQEIKSLMEGGEDSLQTFHDFIKNKGQLLEKNRLILKSLEPLENVQEITVELICSHLDTVVVEEPVPASDMKMTFWEKFGNVIYSGLSIFAIIVYVICFTFYSNHYMYLAPAEAMWKVILGIGFFLLPLVSPIGLIAIRIIYSFIRKLRFKIISVVLAVLTIGSIIITPLWAFLSAILSPCTQSLTEDPNNYLLVDEYVEIYNEDIYKLFPSFIPFSAEKDSILNYISNDNAYKETTKYHYRYRNCIDPDFEIFAEWKLPKQEYESEKRRLHPKERQMNGVRQKGDWTCVYYEDFDEPKNQEVYYYTIFAYNDKTQTVRYIMCYCMDGGTETPPYHYSLEW